MGCAHTASPKIAGGRMLFMDKVTLGEPGWTLEAQLLRGTQKISADNWFFDGHFKNDSPARRTLMFEGCLRATSAVYGQPGLHHEPRQLAL